VIFIGHGVTLAEAGGELTSLVRKLGVPVISSPNGMGCFDMIDPLSLGFIGRNGAYAANEAGRHADLVLAIGARFDVHRRGWASRAYSCGRARRGPRQRGLAWNVGSSKNSREARRTRSGRPG
jgi:thiamine pyrophosphate-dependent acetolactate synthase large subunit-like protein